MILIIMTACNGNGGENKNSEKTGLNKEQKEASEFTKEENDKIYALLDFEDKQEFEFAEKGLIASPDQLELKDEDGKVIWTQKAYEFLEVDKAPDSANPSLWRNSQLNHITGLFEVTDGIYQVRGYDLANITLVEGETGWIIFDPMLSVECAQAAMQLVEENLGKKPVKGIIISHTHVDHYGGIKGIVSEEEVQKNNIPIIVPEDFEEHVVSENVYAGTAMGRRASYQYGPLLPPSDKGNVGIGLSTAQSRGTISYISPTDEIKETGETRVIDGVKMEFQMTPGTEAPAEMNTWFPDKNALWMAENCTATLHNLYTLRGAQVRDGNAWAGYIMDAITLYGKDVEVVFQSHNWPHWGNDFIHEYLENTAAMYKFINDQSLMYINQGYTSDEIANMITLPESLEKPWYTRQYYGTVVHNSKAVYQKYMGWYDANPIHLFAMTPVDKAKKTVEYMGGAEKVLDKALKDFEKGEYQWVAEVTNMLVFADPENKDARYLCADALEQLGYRAESGTWRNCYLTAAMELRAGNEADANDSSKASSDVLRSIQPYMVLDYLGIHIDSNAAEDLNLKINFKYTDAKPIFVTVKDGVLLYQKDAEGKDVDASIIMPTQAMAMLLDPESIDPDLIKIEGDDEILNKLTEHMVKFDPFFNIVEP